MLYQHADCTGLSSINCLLRELIWHHLSSISWSPANRNAAAFLQLEDGVAIPMSLHQHLPLVPRVPMLSIFPLLASSTNFTVALDGTFPTPLEIGLEHCVEFVYTYLSPGYSPSNLLSPHLAASEVAVCDITLNVTPGDGARLESLTETMHGLQN